jgi:hypothetical protein
MMGLPICLDDFPGVIAEAGLLEGLGILASRFGPPVCFFLSWCSSWSGPKSLEPLTSVFYTYAVGRFLPYKTRGRQLRQCS